MFSKLLTSSALLLALSLQVHGHAAVAPALGVSGTPVRNDVKRPSTAQPCGAGVNIASAIDTSTAVTANADGSFDATGIDFNAGADGSRQFTAKVDSTGTGKSFVAATITTNGDKAPTSVGSQPIVAQLPAGTKCTGGATGNKCLVQFVSTAGFGNCVVVQQGAGAAGGAATAASAAAPAASATSVSKAGSAAADAAAAGAGAAAGAAAANAASGAAAKKGGAKKAKKGKKAKKAHKAKAAVQKQRDLTVVEDVSQVDAREVDEPIMKRAGTTAARALLYDLEEREEDVEVAKRGLFSWVWA